MNELKKQIMDSMNDLNQKWVEKIKVSAKDGLDLTEMFGEYSSIVKKVDESFRDAEERFAAKKGKKKFW